MRILILIPSLRNGGAERSVSRLSQALESKGFEITVVSFSREEAHYNVKNHIALGIGPSNKLFFRALNVVRRTIVIKKIKKAIKPNVSIGFLSGPNLVNYLSRLKDEIIISSVRSAVKHGEPQSLLGFINSLVYKGSDLIVAVSQGVKVQLIEKYHVQDSKIKVIYNFTDIQRNLKSRKTIPTKIRLISLGRLEIGKGHWHLLFLMKELVKLDLDVSLTILGEGTIRHKLEDMILSLGLNDYVYLPGFQRNINAFLKHSDIFLFSSSHEGFGNVIIEAMNMGIPVISTNVPHGPKEIINPNGLEPYSNDDVELDEKYGLLVDYGDNSKSNQLGYYDSYIVNQFVEKVLLLINNQTLYQHYSRQSLKRVKDFSEEKLILDWLSILEK